MKLVMGISNTKNIAQFITAFGFQIVVFTTVIYAVIQGNSLAGVLLNIYAGFVILCCANILITEAFVQYTKLKNGKTYRGTVPSQQEPRTIIKLPRTHIGSVFSIFEIAIFFHYGFWGYLVLWLLGEYAQYIQRKNITLAKDCA